MNRYSSRQKMFVKMDRKDQKASPRFGFLRCMCVVLHERFIIKEFINSDDSLKDYRQLHVHG